MADTPMKALTVVPFPYAEAVEIAERQLSWLRDQQVKDDALPVPSVSLALLNRIEELETLLHHKA